MMDMYSAVLSIAKATMFVEQIFEKFDTDNDGFIDFKVLACKTAHLHQNLRELFICKMVWSITELLLLTVTQAYHPP